MHTSSNKLPQFNLTYYCPSYNFNFYFFINLVTFDQINLQIPAMDNQNKPKKRNNDTFSWGSFGSEFEQESTHDKLNQLDAFLSSVEDSIAENRFNLEIKNSLEAFTISDYTDIEIPEDLQQKLEHIKAVVKEIENKPYPIATYKPQLPQKPKIDYIKELNPEQLAASTDTDGPMLVIAGAGSGKTRVIVHRVAYLLETGIDPSQILLLTFTRKAAQEMLDRVEQLTQDHNAIKVAGGTFHSFASYVLRRYANMLEIPPNFTIMDQGDAEDVVDLIRNELKLGAKDRRFPKKRRVLEIISSARNRQKAIKDVIELDFSGLINYVKDIELLAQGYFKYKRLCALFDFDDLLQVLRDALLKHLPFRQHMQNAFKYVMVDEFQDTNIIQKEIVDLIAEKHRNIMVVGDDSQSIYSFRGANFENILRFPETYPGCKVIKIERNYRSNQNILTFTNQIIDSAKLGYRKQLFSERKSVLMPTVMRFEDQGFEASFIVDRIEELIEKNIPLNEIAVLNRADWHNRYVQAELSKRNIPYIVVGGFRFSERMHVKDIIGFLKIVFNPTDAVAWNRILKLLPGIGSITANKIVKHILQLKGKIDFSPFLKGAMGEELKRLSSLYERLREPDHSLDSQIEIIRNYYAPILEARDVDFKTRLLDIEVMIDLAAKYKRLDDYLSDFALDPPSKNLAGKGAPLIDENEENGKITISTIHSSKGLEWYAVFVPHALDGLVPSVRATDFEEMEEERRLFYVACSRAKEELYITYPSFVSSANAYFSYPSRFLAEVDKKTFVLSSR